MIEATYPAHPVGISHYLDGHIPNGRYPNPSPSEEKVYLQPTIQLQEVPKGAEVEASEDQSICQRLSAARPSEELRNWFDRNRKTLGWIAGGYLAFRILTRRR